jgi:hypothetical protein
MDARRRNPPRSDTPTPWRLLALAPALLALALAGCGAGSDGDGGGSALVSGSRGGSAATLADAARIAHRFAGRYAPLVYRRHLPQLPGATSAVMRELDIAAERVPRRRRGLRPRPLGLDLEPLGASGLHARLSIGDGRSPAFTVGFTVGRRGSRWRVVAISPPS